LVAIFFLRENVFERSLVLSPGKTLKLDGAFVESRPHGQAAPSAERLDQLERDHIGAVLDRYGWKINGKGNAADALGLKPNTLRARMRKLGVTRPER
jgi:formate hydrogenlyase transcriptional activator